MKSIGIVRRLDLLGRIVLPKETRKEFSINAGDSMEIFVDEDRIVLKNMSQAAHFAGKLIIQWKLKGRR